MESRRVILAVALSLMVLLTWNYFFPPVAPVATENRTAAGVNQSAAPQAAGTAVSAPEAGQQTVQFTPDRQNRKIPVDVKVLLASSRFALRAQRTPLPSICKGVQPV